MAIPETQLEIASAHSQAHLQFAQANAETKNCKRACLPASAFFADPKKQN